MDQGTGLGIVNHLLAGIRYEPSPNRSGPMSPRLGLIHYTAGTGFKAALDHMCDSASDASCHVLIGMDGKIVQLVPFNIVAWHAGPSEWKGVPRCNSYSIGIELVNPGYLGKSGLKAKHKFGGPIRTWALYPKAQVDACIQVARAVKAHYGVEEWVGHDDVAPGRKVDPGPAWDWASFRSALLSPHPGP